MKKLIIFLTLVVLVEGFSLLQADKTLGLYRTILLVYLFSKMILSFTYKPIEEQAPQFRVAAVVPSYNEAGDGLLVTLESLLFQTYPIEKIYIIDDGSSDTSGFDKVSSFVETYPELCQHVVVHRLEKNAGKRHAQAWAFRDSDAEVFLTVDSDSYIYPNALEELLKPFNDPDIYAVTGHINARNRDKNLLTQLIDIRYDNAFRVERAAQSETGNILTCSGPLSVYRREVVIPNIDRYTNQRFLGVKVNIGDDRCLTNYANKLGKTKYQSTARCDTDVPTNLSTFAKQQVRWNKSFFRETLVAIQLWKEKPMVAFWSILELVLFILLLASFFNILFGNVGDLNLQYILYILSGIVLSALARNVHYAAKHPLLFLFAPLYGMLHIILLQPIRVWALLTIRNVNWGTRQKKIHS